MTSFGSQMTGTFTVPSTVTPFNISLPPGYDEFSMVNITDIGSTASATPVMRAYGTSAMSAGSAYYNLKTNGAATNALEVSTTTGGFTVVPNSGSAALGALVTNISAVSQAGPAVVSTATTTGLVANSSIVRLYNIAGMEQIGGYDFTIGTVVANTSFTLKNMDTTNGVNGFNAAGTTGSYAIVPFDQYFYPRRRNITHISQAAQAIVTMAVTANFAVGEYVRLVVPGTIGNVANSGWGMTQANGLQAKVVAIGAADASGFTNTVTLDLNTTSFGAFVWPQAQAAAGAFTPAQIVPIAESANILTQAETNNSFTGVQIGSTVQTANKQYQWFAKKAANLGDVVSL